MNRLSKLIQSPVLQISLITRYSGVYLQRPESVSDHTSQVALIALLIANEIKTAGSPVAIDQGRLCYKAIIHDIDESLLCDIPRNIKYYSPELLGQIDELSDKAVRKIANYHNYPALYTEWCNAKDETVEGLIIRVSDLIHVIRKIHEEIALLNNKLMLKVSVECLGGIQAMISKITKSTDILDTVSSSVLVEILQESYQMCADINAQNEQLISMYCNETFLTTGN